MTAGEVYDDPAAVAEIVASLARPVLLGLDVDGVLAPIVAHADDAELLRGIDEVVTALAALTPVAVVSGRSVDDLHRFEFSETITVIGSHGMERRAGPALELDDAEHARLRRLTDLADAAADQAGEGAWVERKPAGAVLHVREAQAPTSDEAVDELLRRADDITGAHVKTGDSVVELLTRTTSKATAVAAIRAETGAAAVAFVGDDLTDEEVFAALGPGDCSIRVGGGETAARHRFAGPPEVLQFLHRLAAALPVD